MKKTMSTYDIVNELLADGNADWSRAAAFAWDEVTAQELIDNYGEPGQCIDEVIEFMNDNTTLIIVDNTPTTYLYQAF